MRFSCACPLTLTIARLYGSNTPSHYRPGRLYGPTLTGKEVFMKISHWCKILGLLALALTLALGVSGPLSAQTFITQADCCPVTISQPGSYRLSSNLNVPSNTNGIEISSNDVTIDLNGFR